MSMDQCHIYPEIVTEMAKTLVRLQTTDYANRGLLSNDSCIYSDFCATGGEWAKLENMNKTFGFVFESLQEEFYRLGGSESDYKKMLNENTWNFLNV